MHRQLYLAVDEQAYFHLKETLTHSGLLFPLFSLKTSSFLSFLLNRWWIRCRPPAFTPSGDLPIHSRMQQEHINSEMDYKGSKVSATPTDMKWKEKAQIQLLYIFVCSGLLKSKDNVFLSKVCFVSPIHWNSVEKNLLSLFPNWSEPRIFKGVSPRVHAVCESDLTPLLGLIVPHR